MQARHTSLLQNAYQLFKMGSDIRLIRRELAMARVANTPASLDLGSAEAIALQGLAFLAEEPARFLRFLALTGLEPGEVRARAGTAPLSLAVLAHLAEDESLLLVFAASRAVPPQSIGLAISLLEAECA